MRALRFVEETLAALRKIDKAPEPLRNSR